MIVYGDPQFTASAEQLLDALLSRVGTDHDALRSRLIAAGELEQAIADKFLEPEILRAAEAVTDEFAQAFSRSYAGLSSDVSEAHLVELATELRSQLGQ